MKQPASTKKLVILFAIAHVLFVAVAIVSTFVQIGTSVPIFDVRMFKGYDYEYAATFLAEITPTGKMLYLYLQAPLDFLYPAVLSTFFYLFFYSRTKNRSFAALGLASAFFDYLENILVIVMMTRSPLGLFTVAAASTATIAKALFYAFNYGLTVFFVFSILIRKYRPHQENPS